ncbi:NADH-FMN oxidoreductase RutF, flavin reductase (DIM6/NTAB) family [Gracilibacillus ureilyticus]|uniref:NADH-FMN oxidoreductase RutF, flavin reductase (DIM6/NTAB) family n=1 Tax=Gracilibacillus ureilyticus TaxID=531814 RepID=A0A1H9R399_9BACI|nr:flavin reductase family protein [Gracilibacillus ureilyticus]SER67192.1 NADH-FMN oxidoreductase RutF, flavin reductase (DIM6/NTAB) family [Gracilibacillus ureilyticus]
MNSQHFRRAMSKFATGITVVTTTFDDTNHGMTVNAFMSVSLDPQLITISLDQNSNFYKNADKIKRFGISILREEQQEISMIFAKQTEKDFDNFSEIDGVPAIPDSLATLACTVVNQVEAGDHLLLIANVDKIDLSEDEGSPILYFNSSYRKIDKD